MQSSQCHPRCFALPSIRAQLKKRPDSFSPQTSLPQTSSQTFGPECRDRPSDPALSSSCSTHFAPPRIQPQLHRHPAMNDQPRTLPQQTRFLVGWRLPRYQSQPSWHPEYRHPHHRQWQRSTRPGSSDQLQNQSLRSTRPGLCWPRSCPMQPTRCPDWSGPLVVLLQLHQFANLQDPCRRRFGSGLGKR